MRIEYRSTRGQSPNLPFKEAVLTGLAPDGGLYLPNLIPQLSTGMLGRFRNLSYADLAFEVITRFIDDDSIDQQTLRQIIYDSYASFRHPEVAPLRHLHDDIFLLELFHGPTLAFKDFALQFLGRLLAHYFAQSGKPAVVLGATSGDTGSAAIAGFAGRPNMDIFILHPKGRVSDVQRRQMTTAADSNVYNIALEGTFDDCQDIVKAIFSDADFRAKHTLIAVNSINWARILAQVVYYIYAALKLGAPDTQVNFCVPTGNFGDIYAGHVARQMHLPIGKLIIATNQNDILKRTLDTGVYSMGGVSPTLSPSMDIQISSNFERLLFDLHRGDATLIAQKMARFRKEKQLELTEEAHAWFQAQFSAGSADDNTTLAAIEQVYGHTGVLLDPHTAVGYAVAAQAPTEGPKVVLATAHPAKFPDAVQQAAGIHPELPGHMHDLFEREERYDVQLNDAQKVKQFIDSHTA
ncbi:MAG: threonine synthase [Alphaproteobacteria bacterium]